MQFIDLQYQYQTIQNQINNAILGVLQHGQYIQGPEVFELEGKLASYAGVEFCVSCSSGTDALLMSLMAAEIGPGDAVFTSPFTFIATAEVIKLVGATPIFVDIQKDTFNIDSKLLKPFHFFLLNLDILLCILINIFEWGEFLFFSSFNPNKFLNIWMVYS